MRFKIEHPLIFEAAALALGLLSLAWLYLHSLSPAFPPNDSPETIAAALSLGIQHPPGYPLPTLLGRLGIVVLGLGSAAWRVNCLSALLALCAAGLAASLAWRLSYELGRGPRLAAALMAGLWLGVQPTFWEQATEAKGGIYALNLALGFGLWHASLSAVHGCRAALRWAALLAGLLLAAHFLSAAPWLAATALWLAWGARRGLLHGKWADLSFLLPGLALYAYLPLRAAQDPLLDLGHPSTWSQFIWMLSRAGYSGARAGAAVVQDQLGVLVRALAPWSAAGSLAALAAFGAWALWHRHRPAAAALIGALLLAFLAGAVYNATPADNRWLVLIFCLPGTALLALFGGLGLGALSARGGAKLPAVLGGLAILFAAGFAVRQWPRLDRRASFTAWDYAHDLALSLPKGALYLGEGDYHVLPLSYLQATGRRRDVALVLPALAAQPWYQDLLSRREPGLLLEAAPNDAAAAVALAKAEAARRPVLLGPFPGALDAAALAPLKLRQRGLAREAYPAFAAALPELPRAWAARAPGRGAADLEPVEAALLPWYTVALVQLGNEAMGEHRLAESLDAYRRAALRPGQRPTAAIRVNEARAWEAAGSAKAARIAYELALEAEPGFTAAQEGLAALQAHAKQGLAQTLAQADRYAAAGGKEDLRALKLYDEALQAGFQTPNLWRNVGIIFLRQGDRSQAARAFRRALELKPADPTLLQYLAVTESP